MAPGISTMPRMTGITSTTACMSWRTRRRTRRREPGSTKVRLRTRRTNGPLTARSQTGGQLYFIWSGWEGDTNVRQNLYIARMSNPWTIDSNRVEIARPTHSWKRTIPARKRRASGDCAKRSHQSGILGKRELDERLLPGPHHGQRNQRSAESGIMEQTRPAYIQVR